MKIQINTQKKIVAYGDFVWTSPVSTDIIVTDEEPMKTLQEIAKNTGLEVKGKKKADFISNLIAELAKTTITEVTQMTDTQKYLGIIQAGMEDSLDDNQIKEKLYGAGVGFADLNKVFNEIIKENKLRMSPKERNEKAGEFLTGYTPTAEDVEAHLSKVSALQDFLECSTTQAGAAMRAWAKVNDITLPKAPKVTISKRLPGFGGNHKILADFMVANRETTKEELAAFAKANIPLTKGGKENWGGYANDIWNAVYFAKIWSGEIEAPVSEDEAVDEDEDEVA